MAAPAPARALAACCGRCGACAGLRFAPERGACGRCNWRGACDPAGCWACGLGTRGLGSRDSGARPGSSLILLRPRGLLALLRPWGTSRVCLRPWRTRTLRRGNRRRRRILCLRSFCTSARLRHVHTAGRLLFAAFRLASLQSLACGFLASFVAHEIVGHRVSFKACTPARRCLSAPLLISWIVSELPFFCRS